MGGFGRFQPIHDRGFPALLARFVFLRTVVDDPVNHAVVILKRHFSGFKMCIRDRLYSKRFFADRASLLSVDLGIDEKYKPIIEKHIKFFANKERTQRFYDLEIENLNEENIITGLLSAICRTRTCSFEEVIRVMLTDGELADNKFLSEVEKYGLLDDFWKLCEQHFGYTDVKPTLEKLIVTMFGTYTAKYVRCV